MLKRDVFINAMKANSYVYKSWIISAFSITKTVIEENIPFLIRHTEKGVFFLNPETNTYVLVEDGVTGVPLFGFREPVNLKKGDCENLAEDIKSTYGNLFVNNYVLVWSFGNKLPYMNDRITAKGIEELIIPKLQDDPASVADMNKTDIYVSELKRFGQAMCGLAGLSTLCVPTASPKSMTRHPDTAKIRTKLIEENRATLSDPATIAKIDGELVKLDREWIKGDPSERFYLEAKAFEVSRKKAHMFHGGEAGLGDGLTMDVVENSLSEGWNIEKLPSMANSLRSGSYDRGAQTALGGEAVKFFYRVFQNANITEKDCGSKVGVPRDITLENHSRYVGFSALVNGKVVLTDIDFMKSNIGKTILMRSPATCKTPYTDFCETCMGETLSRYKTGLGDAAAVIGSTFMLAFMKSMHGKVLKTSHYSFRNSMT